MRNKGTIKFLLIKTENIKKRRQFASGSARKPPFSVFKTTKSVDRNDDAQNLSVAGALAKVKAPSYVCII